MSENDSGRIYHIIRDGMVRMAVRGRELKDTDIVESVDEPDSRAWIEADVHRWLTSHVAVSVYTKDVESEVCKWLDRQAAITERECIDKRVADQVGNMWESRKIAELQAENDALLAAHADDVERLDAMGEGELMRKLDELKEKLIAEREAVEACEGCKLTDELSEERDYWKQEVQFCMNAAYPPSHAPERPYDPRVMAYPDREGCTTPSTLVSAMIDGLRDDVRDTVMPIVEESAKAKADCERWREACGSMMDAAHEIERIMAEMELR